MGLIRQARAAQKEIARLGDELRRLPSAPAGQRPAAAGEMEEVKGELRRLRTMIEEPDPLLVPETF